MKLDRVPALLKASHVYVVSSVVLLDSDQKLSRVCCLTDAHCQETAEHYPRKTANRS